MLQSRLFSYPDTHRHRLGVNYNQLPVNAPLCPVANFQRDGFMAINNQGPRPNYQSSIVPLSYIRNKGTLMGNACDFERAAKHETWLGGAFLDLSEVTERQSHTHMDVYDLMAWLQLTSNSPAPFTARS